jgi:hypothetical protein
LGGARSYGDVQPQPCQERFRKVRHGGPCHRQLLNVLHNVFARLPSVYVDLGRIRANLADVSPVASVSQPRAALLTWTHPTCQDRQERPSVVPRCDQSAGFADSAARRSGAISRGHRTRSGRRGRPPHRPPGQDRHRHTRAAVGAARTFGGTAHHSPGARRRHRRAPRRRSSDGALRTA